MVEVLGGGRTGSSRGFLAAWGRGRGTVDVLALQLTSTPRPAPAPSSQTPSLRYRPRYQPPALTARRRFAMELSRVVSQIGIGGQLACTLSNTSATAPESSPLPDRRTLPPCWATNSWSTAARESATASTSERALQISLRSISEHGRGAPFPRPPVYLIASLPSRAEVTR